MIKGVLDNFARPCKRSCRLCDEISNCFDVKIAVRSKVAYWLTPRERAEMNKRLDDKLQNEYMMILDFWLYL